MKPRTTLSPRPKGLLFQPLSVVVKETGVLAIASRARSGDVETSIVLMDLENASDREIAFLVSIFAIDSDQQLFQPSTFPERSPFVVLFPGLEVRHGRDETLPPWAIDEARRLSDLILAEYPSYLDDFRAAGLSRAGIPPRRLNTSVDTLSTGLGLPPVQVDLSRSPISQPGVRWDHVVRIDYARDRYMEHLSSEALACRAADIAVNSYLIDELGRISCRPLDPGLAGFFKRIAEIVAEAALRGLSYPDLLRLSRRGVWPPSSHRENLGKPAVLNSTRTCSANVLVKYGQEKHLRAALEDGIVRLNPASSYSDPSLNAAQRDEELSADLDVQVYGIVGQRGLDLVDREQSKVRKLVRKHAGSNFFVFCVSNELSIRLLRDFPGDSCLVIHDPVEFQERLFSAALKRLPGWTAVPADVTYYDPLQVNAREVDVLFWKHFRFAYQREYRFAILPPDPTGRLDPIDLELGPLSDICELLKPI